MTEKAISPLRFVNEHRLAGHRLHEGQPGQAKRTAALWRQGRRPSNASWRRARPAARDRQATGRGLRTPRGFGKKLGTEEIIS